MIPIIRKVSSLELSKYAEHLKRLGPEDRYLRFGYQINDEGIQRYVDKQYRIKQILLGAFDDHQNMIAAIEIVFEQSKYSIQNELAEIGLSVEPSFRGQGLGSELFEKAVVLTRNRNVKQLLSHCLAQNRWMKKIAISHGMKVVSQFGDTTGTLELAPANAITIMAEMIGDGMAMLDYTMLANPFMFNPGTLAAFLYVSSKEEAQG